VSADALATLETAVMKTPTYCGELVHRWVSGPFQITESLFRGGSALPTHSHESPYFTFTLQGSYRERFGTCWRLCTPGTGVGHPAQEAHSQVFDREPTLLMRLAFDGLASEEPLTLVEPTAATSPLLMRTLRQLHEEIQHRDDSSDMIVEGLAYELAARALCESSVHGGSRLRAERARAFLRSSLQRPASVAVIAAELGVSRATLYRDFRSAFGCTPGDYLRETRIQVAIDALGKSRRPVGDIAAECGFYDQSHFDRLFRLALGVSPTEYRMRRSS